MIEDFPDLNCDVEALCTDKMEQQDIHKVINQLNSEETHDYLWQFSLKTRHRHRWRRIMGISRQMLSYKLKFHS